MAFTTSAAAQRGNSPEIATMIPGRDGMASAISLARGVELTPGEFIDRYGDQLGLGRADSLGMVSETAYGSSARLRFRRYRQFHNGMPVLGADLMLALAGDHVRFAVGRLVPGLDIVRPRTLPDGTIIRRAEAAIARSHRLWVGNLETSGPAEVDMVLSAPAFPASPESYRAAFRYRRTLLQPLGNFEVDLDAWNGRPVNLRSSTAEAWTEGSVASESLRDGTVTINAQFDGAETWQLVTANPYPIETIRWINTQTKDGDPFTIPGTYQEPDALARGVTAHWATQSALDYFMGYHGLTGFDAFAGGLRNLVWPGPSFFAGAYFAGFVDNRAILIYQGAVGKQLESAAALDVASHELTHVVIATTSQLYHQGEAGALNESFADIFGARVEHMIDGNDNDWSIGEDYDPSKAIRFINNPKSPNTYDGEGANAYGGQFWKNPNDPNVDSVHFNCGVQNYWFYLLAKGGNGHVDDNPSNAPYTVVGIGNDTAADIAYLTMTALLGNGPGFLEAAAASEMAAVALFGEFSQARKSVIDAWGAVNVPASAWTPPVQSPAPGETDVFPWPTRFEWEADADGVEWDIEVSKNPDFSVLEVSTTTSDMTTLSGKTATFVEIELKPGETYHWRVRPIAADGPLGWRAATQFATSDMIPQPYGPTFSKKAHPWRLPFAYSSVGARYYEIEVYRGEGCDKSVFPSKRFDIESKDVDLTSEITVPINEVLAWRVRSRAAWGGGNVSDWSPCTPFQTTMPQAVAVSPTGGSEYPWPVTFEWEQVRGAEYDFEVSEQGGGTSINEKTKQTSFDVELPAAFWVDNVFYDWSVGITGPPLGTDVEPEPDSTRQKGKRSAVQTFRIDGNATQPNLISPSNWTTNNPVCLEFDKAPITFEWSPVQGAAAYELTIVELRCPLTNPPSPCQPTQTLVHQDLYTDTKVTLSSGNIGEINGPTSANDNIGYAWRVRAYSAGGFPGVDPQRHDYGIGATRPQLVAPEDGSFFEETTINFSWSSGMAHGGGFIIEVYEGKSCGGSPEKSAVVFGSSNGTTSHSFGLEKGKAYSWRVRPFVYGHCPNYGMSWSLQCNAFETKAEPLDTPQVIDFGSGVIGSMFVLFSEVTGAETYNVQVRETSPSGPLVGNFTFTNQQLANHKNQIGQALGEPQPYFPDWWVATIGGTQAVNHYFFRVQACDGNASNCSEWSEWGEWVETFGWPF